MNTQYPTRNVQLPRQNAAVIGGEECAVSARCLPMDIDDSVLDIGYSESEKSENLNKRLHLTAIPLALHSGR